MSKILFEVRTLISEVTMKHALAAGGITSAAALLGASAYLGIPLLLALSKSILNFLIFCIIIDGSVKITALSVEKLKWITEIDDFLRENYNRLKLNGYNNIEAIEQKALAARDYEIKKCNDQITVTSEDGKIAYHILKLKCSNQALYQYMLISLTELFNYYIKLLDAKRIDNAKATSLNYILSHQEETPFNLVLTKIINRFRDILELLDQDVDKFESEVLAKIKTGSKPQSNVNQKQNTPSLKHISHKPTTPKQFYSNNQSSNRQFNRQG